MELRKAEAEVDELKTQYKKLCRASMQSKVSSGDYESASGASGALALLPPLQDLLAKVRQDRPAPAPSPAPAGPACNEATSGASTAASPNSEIDASQEGDAEPISLSAKEALSTLESLKLRLDGLEGKCTKFRKRLGEKDPITDARRYGAKTAARVVTLLDLYDALVLGVSRAFGDDDSTDSNNAAVAAVQSLRQTVQSDEERARQAEARAKDAAMEEAAHAAKYAQKLEEERRQREVQEERERIMQEAELHRLAIEARQLREEEEARAEREEREVDRAFVASIVKGPDGVRAQLKVLRDGCAASGETGSFDVAIGALHTLFSQIMSHPEEIKFRRIRRDHPKFNQDIGRHPGGKEVFIAAGFTLETLDGVKSFFSKEPDLESDMDGWSAWFDGLKKTLEIIDEEMIK